MHPLDASPAAIVEPVRHRGSLLLVALVAGLMMSSFVGLRIAHHDGDLSVFVAAGDDTTDPAVAPPGLTVQEDSRGYDGQFFYRVARSPLSTERIDHGVELDRPEYRHARIGYPLSAWALSLGGRADLVLGAMVAVNVAAAVALAAATGAVARDAGRSPWWGLLVAGWAGIFVAVARDLAEPLALALLLAAVLALRRHRWLWAAVALTAASLTRETSLVLAFAIVGAHLADRWRRGRRVPGLGAVGRRVPLAVGLAPLAAYGAWRVLLRAWWGPGATARHAPESFFTVPFVALVRQLAEWTLGLGSAEAVDVWMLVQLLLVLGVLACHVTAAADTRAGLAHERLALLGFLALLAMVPAWDRSVVFLRWPAEAVAVGTVIALSSSRDLRKPLVVGTALLAATTVPTLVIIV